MQDMFIRRLVELMEEKDMSQLELSKRVGTTNVTISRYIGGERKPRIDIIEKIAEVFGVSVDYLLGLSNVKDLSSSKLNPSYKTLYNKLDEISATISSKKFTKEQILIIENLLETNKDFLLKLNPPDKNII
jgi:transcriptional regulator with XRE-family HTH domain